MNKRILALAVAGAFSCAAQAQSNVTMYGVIDANYTTLWGDGKRMTVVDPGGISGSRLGFKGSEELGNGLKAVFVLEFGSLKNDINQGIAGSRQTYVGLQGSLGTVIGGYIYSPADEFNSGYDGLSNSGLLSARSNMLNDGGFSTKQDDTLKNAVAYISPNMKGLTLSGVVGKGEQVTGPKETIYALGGEYVRGPFKTAVLYHQVNNRGGTVTDQREVALGVGYDFGVATLLGTYVTKKATNGGRDNSWAVGARIPAGPGSVRLSYAKLSMSDDSGNKDARGWTAAYFYDLSKRTTLYTGYHTLYNGDLASYSHERLTGMSAGSNARLVSLGIRHKF